MENIFKGTKGKWEFQKPLWHNQSYEEGLRLFVERGNIQHTLLEVRGWKISKQEVLSNALLISKAPEMLEALQSVIRLRDLIGYDESIVDESNIEEARAISKMLNNIESVIKSATEL